MSYILDALRRAEADRARGAVPGLHANNMPADPEPAARRFTPRVWAAAAVLVVAAAVLVFGALRSVGGSLAPGPSTNVPELNPVAAEPVAAAPVALVAPAAPAVPGAPVPPGVVSAVAPVAAPPMVAAAVPVPGPALPASPPRLVARAAAGRVGVLEPSASLPRSTMPVAVAPVDDLSPDVRAQLPRLVVGGAIYSAAPADRMLILNGQVFHEGDRPAADTVLEQIRLKNAVLNYRGQRYQISY